MITKDNKLVASFEEIGSHLTCRGNYKSAVLEVKNAFQFDKKTGESLEIVKTLEPMQTIREPEYSHATRNVTFNNEFLMMSLSRPIKPRKGAPFSEWTIFEQWNKTSENDKIEFQLNKYAHDINSVLISFEVL